MRKFLVCFMFFLLMPLFALADIHIIPTLTTVPVGEILDFRMEGTPYKEYQYTMTKDGQEIFKGEWCPYGFGSYRPREKGFYTLTVSAGTGDGNIAEEASLQFEATGALSCHLSAPEKAIKTGSPSLFTIAVSGAAGDCTYVYHVSKDNERIAAKETDEPEFSYVPFEEGEITVEVLVTDSLKNTAHDSVTLLVEKGSGQISITGDLVPFYTQGGIKTYEIHMPGVWIAQKKGDFFTISHETGTDGDLLTVEVSESYGEHRDGSVVFTSGENKAELPIVQLSTNGVEEEVYFSKPDDFIHIDGKSQLSWMNAEEKKTFSVEASDHWQFTCDADFVSVRQKDNYLEVSTEKNTQTHAREAKVELHCGSASAVLYIFQPPLYQGADVKNVTMKTTEGTAYQDTLTAQVRTSLDAETLLVSSNGWQKTLKFSEDQAQNAANEKIWNIEIPLTGNGKQTLIFSAENMQGSNQKKVSSVTVIGEEAFLTGDSASFIKENENGKLVFKATAAADNVSVLGAKNQLIGEYTIKQAEINRCLPDDPWGRYAEWTIHLSEDTVPVFVQLGEQQLPVSIVPPAPKEFVIYSQNDGWWKDKAYSYSTLEHSGCAIFALSHALQSLNFPEEATDPEQLAKTYAFCLLKGGTMNSTLIGHAGDDLGFKTRFDLYNNRSDIKRKLEQGAVFSFSVVKGHIAAIIGMSEDGKMFRVVDSAPSASIERMKGTSICYQDDLGNYIPVSDLGQFPGSRYYIETNAFGGLEYWLDASYVARRGVRLIQPK